MNQVSAEYRSDTNIYKFNPLLQATFELNDKPLLLPVKLNLVYSYVLLSLQKKILNKEDLSNNDFSIDISSRALLEIFNGYGRRDLKKLEESLSSLQKVQIKLRNCRLPKNEQALSRINFLAQNDIQEINQQDSKKLESKFQSRQLVMKTIIFKLI